MWCAYAFAALAFVSLPAAIRSGSAVTLVSWVSQTFLQLVLLSVIIVGQNLLAAAADHRSEATYSDADALLHEVVKLRSTFSPRTPSYNGWPAKNRPLDNRDRDVGAPEGRTSWCPLVRRCRGDAGPLHDGPGRPARLVPVLAHPARSLAPLPLRAALGFLRSFRSPGSPP